MSRSGYVKYGECDPAEINLYRGAVERALQGKRGQRLLEDLLAALDSMPEKRLIANELVTAEGEVCALGCLAKVRGIDVSAVDPENRYQVGRLFDIAPSMAAEIVFVNDEDLDPRVTPEQRWAHVRKWVASQILPSANILP